MTKAQPNNSREDEDQNAGQGLDRSDQQFGHMTSASIQPINLLWHHSKFT